MKTVLYSHPACTAHAVPAGNPETPQRLDAVLAALSGPEFAALERRTAPRAALEDIGRAHGQRYIDLIGQTVPRGGFIALDADTALAHDTFTAALHAAGAACQGVDDVLTGAAEAVFCATRPPGHHARPAQAMGFCYFSTIAIAALRAQQAHGLERVAVIDFDVHHGNGTQEILWDAPGALYISLHQQNHYPGTGLAAETGGKGAVLNLPMPDGTRAADWMNAFERQALPALAAHRPQLILVSAGFDAHADDPLGGFALRSANYRTIGAHLAAMAQQYANSRLVCVLEGGYDLAALGRSTGAFVQALATA